MKQIEDYNYWIDEYGNVFNKDGYKLKQRPNNKGYYGIKLHLPDKTKKWIYPHRYVAKYWVDNPNNFPQVDHLDCNKLNNHYTNLEWVTNQENRNRAVAKSLHAHGETNGMSKLKEEDVLFIRQSKLKYKELCEIFSVNMSTISKIKTYQIWKHI